MKEEIYLPAFESNGSSIFQLQIEEMAPIITWINRDKHGCPSELARATGHLGPLPVAIESV